MMQQGGGVQAAGMQGATMQGMGMPGTMQGSGGPGGMQMQGGVMQGGQGGQMPSAQPAGAMQGQMNDGSSMPGSNMQQMGMPNPMAGQAGMPGMGMGVNPLTQMAAMTGMTPAAMQAMYQQYAMRLAAMQRMATGQNPMGMDGGMPGMGMGMMGGGPGMMGPGMMGPGMMGPGMGPAARFNAGGMGGAPGDDGGKGVFWKTRICNKWKDGKCPYGDKCRYAHGEHELRTASDPHPMEPKGAPGGKQMGKAMGQRDMIELMKKTRLCGDFMNTGQCKYGDKCTFAHGQHELRAAPNMAAGGPDGAQQAPKPELRKTRLCERFMATGLCNYGDKCTFAHGHHELRPMGSKPGPAAPGAGAAAGSVAAAAPAPISSVPSLGTAHSLDAGGGSMELPSPMGSRPSGELDQQGAVALGAGMKRGRLDEIGAEGGPGLGDGSGPKRQNLQPASEGPAASQLRAEEEEDAGGEPDCPLCAKLVAMGKPKVLATINALENPKAKQLGCMIVAASQRLDQLWHRCTPNMVMNWLSKTAGLSVMDKIEVLKAVLFHVHGADETTRSPEGGLGLDSQKYVEMGLPPECADFVYMCMEGKEGNAAMSEYFHMLEVCKALFGIDDSNYYTVSTAVAGIMMGM